MWTQTFIPQSNISFWQPGRQAQLIDVKTRISWFCWQSHTGHHGSECRRGDMGRHTLGNVTEYQWDSSFMLLLRTWKWARLTGIEKTNKETKAPFEVLLKFLSGTKTPNHRYSLKIAFFSFGAVYGKRHLENSLGNKTKIFTFFYACESSPVCEQQRRPSRVRWDFCPLSHWNSVKRFSKRQEQRVHGTRWSERCRPRVVSTNNLSER